MGGKSLVGLILVLAVKVTLVWSGGRPLKVYAKGYNGRNLPPGGWTAWFNLDAPYKVGDYELLYQIKNVFGRGCQGVPCKKPLAIKALSIDGYSPWQEGDYVTIHPRWGFRCVNHEQSSGNCADYKVRFYCPGMAKLCRAKQSDMITNEANENDDVPDKLANSKTKKPKGKASLYNKDRNRTIRKEHGRLKTYRGDLLDIYAPLKHRWTTEELRNRPTKQVKTVYKQTYHPRHSPGPVRKHAYIDYK